TPGDEEASMSSPDGVRAFADLERNTGEIVEAMRLTIRLLRALAPLAVEMRELQGALAQLQEATGTAAGAAVLDAPAAPRLAAPPAPQRPQPRPTPEFVPGISSAQTPAAPAAEGAQATGGAASPTTPPDTDHGAEAVARPA